MSPLQGLGLSCPHFRKPQGGAHRPLISTGSLLCCPLSLQVWLLHAEAGPPCHKATTLTHRGAKEPGTEAVRTMALSCCRISLGPI